MTKMIVIGAGVMGASVAFRLAQAGASVTVLETTRIAVGAHEDRDLPRPDPGLDGLGDE